MSILFQPWTLNNLSIPNRFVRSATWEGQATDTGLVTPKLISTMTELAEGGLGLIITGHAFVSPEGQAGPWQLGVCSDECLPGLQQMAQAVHDRGGRIVMQLAHAGNFTAEKLTGSPPLVVSDFEGLADTPRREATLDDIRGLVQSFARAAERARQTGFDGVQIHSAHGYLLSQFLSPAFNKRSDGYGGSLENRSRIHHEILGAVRERVGPDYPVLIKINCSDFADNGLALEDALQTARSLAREGLDGVEVSGGLLTGGKLSPSRPGIDSKDKEAYFRDEAREFSSHLDIPVILVGGIRSFDQAEELVQQGVADALSMSRPLIREPHLVARWKSGDRSPAGCVSDNLCFKPALRGRGIACVSLEKEQSGQE
jgi:2,4-dienoyl-CoA reductase-like NADH-dependent reductase (Old Yellow Enzyme family)